MSTINKPHEFSPNTTASSSQVNDNFDTIYNEFNGSISAANLASNAVTTAKITDSNVTTAKIADSNVTTAKIADGAVTNAKLATGAGQPGGAWTSYTPTFTGFTLGNGTINRAHYTRIGDTVIVDIFVTLGSTSSMGNFTAFSLPVNASFVGAQSSAGTANCSDGGAANYPSVVRLESSTTARVLTQNASGTFLVIGGVTSTAPFTWASTDVFAANFTYQAA